MLVVGGMSGNDTLNPITYTENPQRVVVVVLRGIFICFSLLILPASTFYISYDGSTMVRQWARAAKRRDRIESQEEVLLMANISYFASLRSSQVTHALISAGISSPSIVANIATYLHYFGMFLPLLVLYEAGKRFLISQGVIYPIFASGCGGVLTHWLLLRYWVDAVGVEDELGGTGTIRKVAIGKERAGRRALPPSAYHSHPVHRFAHHHSHLRHYFSQHTVSNPSSWVTSL